MKLTYKQLAAKINKMSAEQQNSDVTVYLDGSDEAFPMLDFEIVDYQSRVNGILDDGHPFISIDA